MVPCQKAHSPVVMRLSLSLSPQLSTEETMNDGQRRECLENRVEGEQAGKQTGWVDKM